MEEKEIIKNLYEKIKEISSLANLNSRDFKFKSWHVGTLNLLRSLPPRIYSRSLSDFKKLSFTDTKYRRDKRDFNYDSGKYSEDLVSAVKILEKITKAKGTIEGTPEKPGSETENTIKKTTQNTGGTPKPKKPKKTLK